MDPQDAFIILRAENVVEGNNKSEANHQAHEILPGIAR